MEERGEGTHESVFERAEDRGEELLEGAGDRIWRALRNHPFLGVAATAAGGMLLASVVGVTELAVGVAAGYAAYRLLRRRTPPSEGTGHAR